LYVSAPARRERRGADDDPAPVLAVEEVERSLDRRVSGERVAVAVDDVFFEAVRARGARARLARNDLLRRVPAVPRAVRVGARPDPRSSGHAGDPHVQAARPAAVDRGLKRGAAAERLPRGPRACVPLVPDAAVRPANDDVETVGAPRGYGRPARGRASD